MCGMDRRKQMQNRSKSRARDTCRRGRSGGPRQYADVDYNADVYVFAVETAMTHEEYDPLDVHQWRFYV